WCRFAPQIGTSHRSVRRTAETAVGPCRSGSGTAGRIPFALRRNSGTMVALRSLSCFLSMADSLTIELDTIAAGLHLQPWQVRQTVDLLDDGNTVAFITRYRKERTGTLNEEQIRAVQKQVHARRQIAERAEAILRLIESQGKLTDELRVAIAQADSL